MSKVSRILLLISLLSCQSPQHQLGDLVKIDAIDSITVRNNSGEHTLHSTKLRGFRRVLAAMYYRPKTDVKLGSIGFSIYVQGKKYWVDGSTHGQYLRIPRQLIDPAHQAKLAEPNPGADPGLIFEFTTPINLDNY
ncbi:hypothetical protein MUN82_05915 [Hymenobacter aerilatus]|uniref:Uncharacterized protein n=1 Tax=Hymenobacter aerilatus TaxID=2932251 RepID=A0A8T9SWM9_9BACT|nr:hypothetical protein [Hymenobacter aerilatus]UOR06632.1 hypothetical protein MUN82_05915 [Hymenobacter aerilatus]